MLWRLGLERNQCTCLEFDISLAGRERGSDTKRRLVILMAKQYNKNGLRCLMHNEFKKYITSVNHTGCLIHVCLLDTFVISGNDERNFTYT